MAVYRGYIFRWGIPSSTRGNIVDIWEKLVSVIPGVTITTRYEAAEGNSGEWLVGKYESVAPISDLHKENPSLKNSRGLFEYPIVFRATRQGTVIILSSGSKIANHFATEHINSQPFPELVPMRVKVNELAHHLIFEDRNAYSVSSLSVNVDAAGENLERADYYGSDLAAASLIYDNLKYQTAFLIGVKSRIGSGTELIRVGSRGFIQISLSGGSDIVEIEGILSYLWSSYYQ